MRHSYRKYKALNQLFYKSIDASIEIQDNKIIVDLYPLVAYSGKYLIDEVSENATRIMYSTLKILDKEEDAHLMFPENHFMISFSPDYRKASIFRIDKTGVLLKK